MLDESLTVAQYCRRSEAAGCRLLRSSSEEPVHGDSYVLGRTETHGRKLFILELIGRRESIFL